SLTLGASRTGVAAPAAVCRVLREIGAGRSHRAVAEGHSTRAGLALIEAHRHVDRRCAVALVAGVSLRTRDAALAAIERILAEIGARAAAQGEGQRTDRASAAVDLR